MKLNIAYPAYGQQKQFEITDEKQIAPFYNKRISQTIEGDLIAPQFEGCEFKITGGSDKDGFPMLQGVLVPHHVRLLLSKGSKCYHQKRDGERRRKVVRGCIISSDIAVINMILIKKGEKEIPGLTDAIQARTRWPKRATKIRKMFKLGKKDDIKDHFHGSRYESKKDPSKFIQKIPKIQRLITPLRRQRKRRIISIKKTAQKASLVNALEYINKYTGQKGVVKFTLRGKSALLKQSRSFKNEQNAKKKLLNRQKVELAKQQSKLEEQKQKQKQKQLQQQQQQIQKQVVQQQQQQQQQQQKLQKLPIQPTQQKQQKQQKTKQNQSSKKQQPKKQLKKPKKASKPKQK